MPIYHPSIYLPENIVAKLPVGTIKLRYSYHAMQASNNDKHGKLPILTNLKISNAKIFEVATDNDGKLDKVGYRVKINKTDDLCLIVSSLGRVVTVWCNKNTDKHKSLNKERYEKRPN